jgi:hypothetical protein
MTGSTSQVHFSKCDGVIGVYILAVLFLDGGGGGDLSASA